MRVCDAAAMSGGASTSLSEKLLLLQDGDGEDKGDSEGCGEGEETGSCMTINQSIEEERCSRETVSVALGEATTGRCTQEISVNKRTCVCVYMHVYMNRRGVRCEKEMQLE